MTKKNSKQFSYTYKPGDWITISKSGIMRKLCVPRDDPYKVVKHHDNGNNRYQKESFSTEKVKSRRVYPFHWGHDPPTRGENNN